MSWRWNATTMLPEYLFYWWSRAMHTMSIGIIFYFSSFRMLYCHTYSLSLGVSISSSIRAAYCRSYYTNTHRTAYSSANRGTITNTNYDPNSKTIRNSFNIPLIHCYESTKF